MIKSITRVSETVQKKLQNLIGLQPLGEKINEGWENDPYSCPLTEVCHCTKDPDYLDYCFDSKGNFAWQDCEILKDDYKLFGGCASALSFGPPNEEELSDYEEKQHKRLPADDSLQDLIDDGKINPMSLSQFSNLGKFSKRLKKRRKYSELAPN